MRHFGVGREVALLGLSLYLLGYANGLRLERIILC
jgi:hypothetical protein